VACEWIGRQREEFAWLSVRYFMSVPVDKLNGARADALSSNRAKMRKLLTRMQHRHPASLTGAIELEQPGAGKHFHHLALGISTSRCRGNHQLFDTLQAPSCDLRTRAIEQHNVLCRHKRRKRRTQLAHRAGHMF